MNVMVSNPAFVWMA